MRTVLVMSITFGLFLLQSCGDRDYMDTGKSMFYLNQADPALEQEGERAEGISLKQQQEKFTEFVVDNSVLLEDIAWDYSPLDDMNTFGDNNSQLMLESETDAPPRLQFKDRSFP